MDVYADLVDIQHGLSGSMAGLVRLAEQLKTTLGGAPIALDLQHFLLLRHLPVDYPGTGDRPNMRWAITSI